MRPAPADRGRPRRAAMCAQALRDSVERDSAVDRAGTLRHAMTSRQQGFARILRLPRFRQLRLDDQSLVILQLIDAFIIELAGETTHLGEIDFLEFVDIAFCPQRRRGKTRPARGKVEALNGPAGLARRRESPSSRARRLRPARRRDVAKPHVGNGGLIFCDYYLFLYLFII